MHDLRAALMFAVKIVLVLALLPCTVRSSAQELANDHLSVTVSHDDGSYQVLMPGRRRIIRSGVGAEVEGQWLRSSDYPSHTAAESSFNDALGSGRQLTVTNTGLRGKPDLLYVLQIYDKEPYGTIQVRVRNTTGKDIQVQAIRSMDAAGEPIIDLAGRESTTRILSDSFSEDWPDLSIYDLSGAPGNLHRGVGSQLIYNRESQQSLFVGALTSDRFLTILHLTAEGHGDGAKIKSYTVESTGTTEIQSDFSLAKSPDEDKVKLSLPLESGKDMDSERVMLEAGPDYHHQLLAYGEAIRLLHQARVSGEIPIGWWSWTAYYAAINQGETLANADWLSEHLKPLGYKYFQIDEGYQYARGEFSTANATQFPSGMRFVGNHITADGLTLGLWTAPFEVTSRTWVYEHHKDWLVHNAQGNPIPIGDVWGQHTDVLYALDTTHPGAQEYLRQTYTTLVREWGVRFIKLDFMDTTAIEGYYYRPNTTALEAQRIGLRVIRETVGDDVVLDKDGSPMLNPVGLVDTGRVSADTGHSFLRSKTAAPGIAARFYMNANFFINDPDAFNITDTYLVERANEHASHAFSEAQVSIALSAVAGGMYEIGDDMLVLGDEKDRLALVENRELLNMAKIGRASTPVDLMTYAPEDAQPSIFLLRESPRESILTVFNWTDKPRSHTFSFAELGFPGTPQILATDVLDVSAAIVLGEGMKLDNPPQSVRVIKLVDAGIAKVAPNVLAQVPSQSGAGETIKLSARTQPGSAPATGYHWDFGDGITSNDPGVSHCYTRAGDFTVQLVVDGVDDVSARQNFTIHVTGDLKARPDLRDNRRFTEPTSGSTQMVH